jgi:hypothetical protein
VKADYRDALIGGGILVAAILAYIYVVEPYLAQSNAAANAANNAAQQAASALQSASQGASSTPSYNLPSQLVLPPFNQGNAPVGSPGGPSAIPTDSSSGGEGGGCGCNACDAATSGGQSYLQSMLNFWRSQGIANPPSDVPPGGFDVLPTPATITPPPQQQNYQNTYPIWSVEEGLTQPNPTISAGAYQRDYIPGSASWTGAQQYKAYEILLGGLFKDASPSLQEQVMNTVNAMPS